MPILVPVVRADDGVVDLRSWFEMVAVEVAAEAADEDALAIAVEFSDIIGERSDIVLELELAVEAAEASDLDKELAAEPLKVLVVAIPLLLVLIEVRRLVVVSLAILLVDGALVLSVPRVALVGKTVLGWGNPSSVAVLVVWELSAMSPRRSRSQPD